MQNRDVLEEVRRRFDDLTESQKRIAETIVEMPELVAFGTVDEVAAKLSISPSTVVRFAYRLGLDGYQELQSRIRDLIRAQIASPPPTVSDDVAAPYRHLGDSVYRRSIEHDVTNILRSAGRLSLQNFEDAVKTLVDSRRICVVGGVTTYSVAYYAALTLSRIRQDVVLLEGSDNWAVDHLMQIGPKDALLAFTFPPYALSTLKVATMAKGSKATLIAVTDSPLSPVGQQADIILPCFSAGLSAQNSLASAMVATNALLNGMIVSMGSSALERYSRINSAMNELDLYILKGSKDLSAP